MIENSREAKDIGRFVRARREKTDANTYSEVPRRRRHVPHLTQSDLADIINVSTVVISKLEQGHYPNLTGSILYRISRALRLSQQQEIYLLGLFDSRPKDQKTSEPAPDWVENSIKLVTHPIVVVDPAYGMVAMNNPAQTLFRTLSPDFAPKSNGAVSIVELPTMREFIVDWESYAASLVSGMKMSYAMCPNYRNYIDQIVRRLEASDPLFRELWNEPDPLIRPTIEKQFTHPEAGTLNVLQILTDIVEAPGLTRVEFIPADEETRTKLENL